MDAVVFTPVTLPTTICRPDPHLGDIGLQIADGLDVAGEFQGVTSGARLEDDAKNGPKNDMGLTVP